MQFKKKRKSPIITFCLFEKFLHLAKYFFELLMKFVSLIYQKQSCIQLYPFDANHPHAHNIPAYISMIHRAYSIPLSKTELTTGFSLIKAFGKYKEFKNETIGNSIGKKE